MTGITPYRVAIPESELDDLRRRLRATRWAPDPPGTGWSRGVPTAYLRRLADYWADDYDWRRHEADLNAHPQFVTEIDGTRVHFLHVRSANPDAVPLMLLHGWPGSVADFHALIGALRDDFHLVAPSLPGFGFSGPPPGPGWTDGRTARALNVLMDRLGYPVYGVHGGDIGAFVAPLMGRDAPGRVRGVHVNALVTLPDGEDVDTLDDTDRERFDALRRWQENEGAYLRVQGTSPQTLAHAHHDSPAGLLAWFAERYRDLTGTADLPDDALGRDAVLTDAGIYWFTGTAGSAAHSYYERFHDRAAFDDRSPVPTAVAVFPTDHAIRPFAERAHTIVRWTEFERGGHFPALEAPDLLAADLRAFFLETLGRPR
ncbi:epoxide hydrolase [Actinomadura spongiicola]|uniref:Epoxide hydrolase n=1 Tax=Actinomadura spongiicola TaxID=2303421 RepID=A0A372G7C9_9ACTN|nr:epoxide hydrolase family protein [Actinomadura spongiicola]RFS81290.1 epoxide hydrolase [Actinomadura spongiicola]